MRDGLRVSFALNEYVFSALCVTVVAVAIGYFVSHRAVAAPVPTPIAVTVKPECADEKAPIITIEQTLYIPVAPSNTAAPAITTEPEDQEEPEAKDPAPSSLKSFKSKNKVPESLRQPIGELAARN